MSNEIVYQVGGIAIILGGSIWGVKFLNNQTKKESLTSSSEENTKVIESLKNDFEKQLKQSKEAQLSLQEENIFLKNKTYHLDKQIISFQESLNTIIAEKNHLEIQFSQDKLTITELQKKLQTVENSRQQLELDNQKKIQELLTETRYLSENFRHEVAKRTEIQQKLTSSELIQKQFDLKEQRQQEAIHKLEQKNRELGQSCIDTNVNLQQEIEHLRGEKNQLQQVLEQRTVNTEKLQSEIAQLIATSLESKESYQKAIAEVNVLKPQVNALETDKIRLQGEVQSQTEQLIQETVRKEQAIAEVDALTQAIERLESEKKQLEKELVTTRQNGAVKQTEILEAEPEIAQKTVEIAEIQEEAVESIEPIPTPVEEVLENPPPVMDAIAEIPEVVETSALQAEPLPDLTESPPSEFVPEAIALPVTTETPLEEISPHSANFFVDKKFIIVGTLSKINREQAKTLIQDAGGIVTSSPSSKTHYVLVGKSPGDKLKKAQKLGISQLTESKFLTLLGMAH